MDENKDIETTEELEDEQPPQGDEQKEIDWKAMSRKHEREAKKNREAAAELEKLKAERMTEQERLVARAEKAEQALKAIEAEKEKSDLVARLARQSGVPAELLEFCADEDAMERFISLYQAESKTPAAPKTQKNRIVRDRETPTSNRDVFAEMVANRYN